MGVLLLAGTACRSKPAPVPPPAGPLEFDDDADGPDEPAEPDERPMEPGPAADAGGCKAGGTTWDGTHEGCLYEVAGCCYADASAACAAAGCDAACQILESAPAQVVCRAG